MPPSLPPPDPCSTPPACVHPPSPSGTLSRGAVIAVAAEVKGHSPGGPRIPSRGFTEAVEPSAYRGVGGVAQQKPSDLESDGDWGKGDVPGAGPGGGAGAGGGGLGGLGGGGGGAFRAWAGGWGAGARPPRPEIERL